MLGKVRRTTRIDVGLCIAFTGIAYLTWVLVVGVARRLVDELAISAGLRELVFPLPTRWLYYAFLTGGPLWDVVGLLWLLIGLLLIVGASRQRWSISWAWTSSICQAMAATLAAVWAALAVRVPYVHVLRLAHPQPVPVPSAHWASLSISLALALLLWTTFLVWLLYERARLRRGPSLRDSVRTHAT